MEGNKVKEQNFIMGELNISQQRFISEYRKTHNVASMLTDEAVIEMIREEMIKTGEIYPEFASLVTTQSGKEQAKGNSSIWTGTYQNTAEVNHLEEAKKYDKPKTQKNYTKEEKSLARKYIAAILKKEIQEAIYGEKGFNAVSNPSKLSGSEGWQELEVLGAEAVDFFDLGGFLGIKKPLNRVDLAEQLNIAYKNIEELESLTDDPEAFDKKFEQITRNSMDYSAIIDFLEALSEYKLSDIQDRWTSLQELKEPGERFSKTLNIPEVNAFNKWAGYQDNAGALTGFAIDYALAYLSGGMSKIATLSAKTSVGVAEAVTSQALKAGMEKEAAEITGQVAGITTAQVAGAGLNSAMFQVRPIADALSDGNISAQEADEINQRFWGLFKFGYVGSAISGPTGAKFAEWIGKAINNEKTISIILNSSLKQPTTLGKVLTNLSENTGIIQKATEFGTSFLMNTEYMALDEGISFGDAMKNLAQMEGVSKIVMAFLGGKTTKFLTPDKVQKITTDIENCKVEIAIYKGQKAIKVTTPDGQENFFASQEELIAFVADRIYTQAGIKIDDGVNDEVNTGVNEGENAGVNQGVKIGDNTLKKGIRILAPEGTPEVSAIEDVVQESLVIVKSKEEALDLFKENFNETWNKDNVLVLNPSDIEKANTGISGTSNGYMSKWFVEANNLTENSICNRNSIESIIKAKVNSGCKKIVIVIPDDFAGSGRSMIVDTAATINSIELPNDIQIELVFSPLIATPLAKEGFKHAALKDLKALQDDGILNEGGKESDVDIMNSFFAKCKQYNIQISVSNKIQDAIPYYQTQAFQKIKEENEPLAAAVELILTNSGTRKGYGREGSNGTMVIVPDENGGLKTPNNNTYGAAPFALAFGVPPEKIKRPSGKVPVKKWIQQMINIQKEINNEE